MLAISSRLIPFKRLFVMVYGELLLFFPPPMAATHVACTLSIARLQTEARLFWLIYVYLLCSTKHRLVEHYSPFCHHCKAFVPTWKEWVVPSLSSRVSSFKLAWRWATFVWLLRFPFCSSSSTIRLVDSRKHQEESINFHFGQVDCAIYGGECCRFLGRSLSLVCS